VNNVTVRSSETLWSRYQINCSELATAQGISRQSLAPETGFVSRSFHVEFTLGKLTLKQYLLQML